MKKTDQNRQRAHPENAPQCHICGRICSTTWNLKQHIEKHYDIHPQKGVLKKKFEESQRQAKGLDVPGYQSGNNLAIVAVNHEESSPPIGSTVVSGTNTSSGGYGLSSMIMPTPAPINTSDSVIDITDDTVKQEKEDDEIDKISER